MRNNKIILEEATRSVRRTFIGSIVGSIGMMAVIGAAGAYGMPEKLTAQALSAAMTTLNVKVLPVIDRARTLATGHRAPQVETAEISAPIPPLVNPVALSASEAAPATPTVQEAAHADPVQAEPVQVAAPSPAMPQVAAEPETPVAAPVEPAKEVAEDVVPAPVVVASLEPPAARAMEDEPLGVSAPLIFEAPVPDTIPPLTGMPEMAPVAAVPAESPAAASQAALSATIELPKPADFSANVWAHLLNPKPQLTPAQLLDLHDKAYDKAETCLAQAVYFEARDQPTKGQEAVAQVVLNRVFSPYYPKDVCSVVYQNAHHYLGCQFTFACDGKPEAIRERGAWVRANRVARAMLAAKVWLPEVAKATHYHAAYVHPNWIREMKVMVRYGIHTFYRPRNWGDGAGEPSWGPAKKSVKS